MTTRKKKLNPTRVLEAIDNVLTKNEVLRQQLTEALQASRANADTASMFAKQRDEALRVTERVRESLRAAEESGQRHYRAAQEQQARIHSLEDVVARHHREANELQAQLRAADETAVKALADAKRARDLQGTVWIVRFTSPSALPYVSFVAATKDDALLKVSRIYLKTKVLDNGARVQVFNNDAEGAFAGEYIIQQTKIANPG